MKPGVDHWRRVLRALEARRNKAEAGLALARRRLSEHLAADLELEEAAIRLEPVLAHLNGMVHAHILAHRCQAAAKERAVAASQAEARSTYSLLRLARRRSLVAEGQEQSQARRRELLELVANFRLASPPQAGGS